MKRRVTGFATQDLLIALGVMFALSAALIPGVLRLQQSGTLQQYTSDIASIKAAIRNHAGHQADYSGITREVVWDFELVPDEWRAATRPDFLDPDGRPARVGVASTYPGEASSGIQVRFFALDPDLCLPLTTHEARIDALWIQVNNTIVLDRTTEPPVPIDSVALAAACARAPLDDVVLRYP